MFDHIVQISIRRKERHSTLHVTLCISFNWNQRKKYQNILENIVYLSLELFFYDLLK